MNTKEEILRALRKTDGFVSGEAISNVLGISRSAIWKNIKSLRESGYLIESVTNRGYRLISCADALTEESIHDNLQTQQIGCQVFSYESIDSTNDEAKRQAQKGAPHGSVFVAEEQTNGKGRLGRVWTSPPKTGLWFSILLRPESSPTEVTSLTLLAGLAVNTAIKKVTGCRSKIKWPNDIVIGSKKVCGILTEMAAEIERINYVVVGIGINVNTEEFPEELQIKATSLRIESGKKVSRSNLLRQVLCEFEALLNVQQTHGIQPLIKEYKDNCVTIGRRIFTERNGVETGGIAEDITEDGELIVRTDIGTFVQINSGEVSVQGIYGHK